MLDIKNLTVNAGNTRILDNVSLMVPKGRIMAVVGASGSGKTSLGMAVLNLLPSAMKVMSGEVIVDGKDMIKVSSQELRRIRGCQIGMVFQEPLSAFDPLFTISEQLDEVLSAHALLNVQQRRLRINEVLKEVQIDDPKSVMDKYPHQLSGGLRQRAMIAQAIICRPALIIADEPTSNLDVTIQARIIRLLEQINQQQGSTVLFVTHDIGLVGRLAHEVAVMQQGRIVEQGSVKDIMANAAHEYTKELLKAY